MRVFVFLCAMCAVPALYHAHADPPKPLDKQSAMRYLPEEARVGQDGPDKYVDSPVLNADVDGDGQGEVIVAYYAVPDTPPATGMPPDSREGYYERARIRVLRWNGSDYETHWESEGFGAEFAGGGDYFAANSAGYYALHFAVIRLKDDCLPFIMCSRAGYDAMGTQFDVWHWNGATYKNVLSLEMTPRLVVSKSRNAKYLFLDRDRKGGPLEPPKVFAWDRIEGKFKTLGTLPDDAAPYVGAPSEGHSGQSNQESR